MRTAFGDNESKWLQKLRTSWQIAHGDTEETLASGTPLAFIKHNTKLTADLWAKPRANAAAQVVHLFVVHMMAISVRHTGFTAEGAPIAGIEDAKKNATIKFGELLADTGGYPSDEDLRAKRPLESELDALARQADELSRGLMDTCVKLEQDDAKRRRTLTEASGGSGSTPKKTRSEPTHGAKDFTPAIAEIHKQLHQLRDRTPKNNFRYPQQPYNNNQGGYNNHNNQPPGPGHRPPQGNAPRQHP